MSLDRPVALKLVLSGEMASEVEVERFRREAHASAHLDHPHSVPIYEVGVHQGQHYFSMRLVEGHSLSRKIEQFAKNPRAAAQLMVKIARALHHAHQRGILHRD
jgi:serine/threonine-protein kinase